MLKFCDFIQVYAFTTNHHFKFAISGEGEIRVRKWYKNGKKWGKGMFTQL